MKTLALALPLLLAACSPDPSPPPDGEAPALAPRSCKTPTARPLEAGAMDVALDAASVAWLIAPPSGGPGRLGVAPRSGQGQPVLFETTEHPRSLRLSGDQVFWLAHDGLWSAPRSGGAPRKRSYLSGAVGARGIAVDDQRVYWSTTSGVRSLPLDAPADVAPELVLDRDTLSLERSGDHLYATTKKEVIRVDLGTGKAQTLLSGRRSLDAIAVDDGEVYVVDLVAPAQGVLLGVPAAGGEAREVTSFDSPSSPGIAARGASVYLGGLDAVLRAPKAGGAAGELYCEGGGPIARDGASLAWLDLHRERLLQGSP